MWVAGLAAAAASALLAILVGLAILQLAMASSAKRVLISYSTALIGKVALATLASKYFSFFPPRVRNWKLNFSKRSAGATRKRWNSRNLKLRWVQYGSFFTPNIMISMNARCYHRDNFMQRWKIWMEMNSRSWITFSSYVTYPPFFII